MGEYSWREIEARLGTASRLLIRRVLDQAIIRRGDSGWIGEGVLVDASLVKPVIEHAMGHCIDLRPCVEWIDERDGIIVPPAVRQDDWTDFCTVVHGIGYNAEPLGANYSPRVVNERRTICA